MLVPPVTQLPVFVGTSIVLSSICQPPTVFDSESFLTLTSLAHADPTATLPVVLGLREKQEEKRLAEKRAQGHIVIEPRKVVRTGLRILSIGRILVASMVPGGVVLYWVSSATFGLFQSWVFDWWERQRALKRRVQLASDSPSPSVPTPAVPTPAVPRQRKKSRQ
ncbi:hypothetical protein EWM64_g67 [Hericium alpestre]|uniref:Uncharacterized protein n=1 Tax=Hericium alpestre TaxID=135208 RepID=A0A4Z0AC12_9AGAM|nr:hypothetical protein EWM64_g67 [Hericium alpestre]